MAISGSGAAAGAMSGAGMGAMFGPWGMAAGAGIGGLMGLFSGTSLTKEEKALLAQLDAMSKQQSTAATGLLAEGKQGKAKFGAAARNVRNAPGMQQAMGYHSAILGGDRARMQSATSGVRSAMADTYRGGRSQIEAGGMRAPQKAKAQAEMARQETGQLAGLVQGQQGASADALGNMELNVQQLMAQYLGLGEQSATNNAYAASNMMSGASNNIQTALGVYGGKRQQDAANDRGMGASLAPLIGYGMQAYGGGGFGGGGKAMNNTMTGASRPAGGFSLGSPGLAYGGATGGAGGGSYFNASGRPRSNPWSGVVF